MPIPTNLRILKNKRGPIKPHLANMGKLPNGKIKRVIHIATLDGIYQGRKKTYILFEEEQEHKQHIPKMYLEELVVYPHGLEFRELIDSAERQTVTDYLSFFKLGGTLADPRLIKAMDKPILTGNIPVEAVKEKVLFNKDSIVIVEEELDEKPDEKDMEEAQKIT